MFVTPAMMALLESVPFDEVCITSGVWLSTKAAPDDAFWLGDVAEIAVQFEPAKGAKCQRCWKVLPDVSSHTHPGTCARCDAALA